MDATNSKENGSNLLEWRIKNYEDAISLREPEKVPVVLSVYGYAFHYAGTTYEAVKDNPENAIRAFTKIFDDIEVDCQHRSGINMPMEVMNALGRDDYVLGDDKCTIAQNPSKEEYMSAEDYPELINNTHEYLFGDYLKAKYPAFRKSREEALASIKNALRELQKYLAINKGITDYCTLEKQIYSTAAPVMSAPNQLATEPCIIYKPLLDPLFSQIRGIRNTLTDLRRRPNEVKRASIAIFEELNNTAKGLDMTARQAPLPMLQTFYHPEPFISRDDFREYFFEPLKELYGPLLENGKKCFLFGEADMTYSYEIIREMPKGSMVLKLDQEDPFEVYEIIGDRATLACGINLGLLAAGTKQQCVDYVKRCFDTFAPGGGFVFMPNAALLSPRDAKLENLYAVFETANELGRK
jgi:hypothetical protein